MTARAWKSGAVGGVVLLGLAAACRQLVGIDDEPPTDLADAGAPRVEAGGDAEAGPTCGMTYTPTPCESCLEKSCCTEATACAGGAACAGFEQCMGACGGEPACRARCVVKHRIGPDPLETHFAACLAANCANACNITCGGLFPEGAGEDAAAGCQSCVTNKSCPVNAACAGDPECQAISWCYLSNPAPDRAQACVGAHDAGLDVWTAQNNDTSCSNECATGNRWYCVGNPPPPVQGFLSTQFTAHLVDTLAVTRNIADASVAVCSQLDSACKTALSSGTTGADGKVTLTIPPAFEGFGATGYASIAGVGLISELVFWGFPLSEPSFSYAVGTLTPVEFGLATAGLGPVDLSSHAFVFALAIDCEQTYAQAVQFSIAPTESDTHVFYFAGSGIDTKADRTDRSGLAVIVNVPVGQVRLTTTPVALSRPSSVVTGWAQPNALTGFLAPVTQ